MVQVIQHDVLGFILENIECQEPSECASTEASDLVLVIFCTSGSVT